MVILLSLNNQLSVDLLPVEHILVEKIPETKLIM